MKTFKQHSKEAEGYYIDADGVAVFTDILGHGDKSRSSDKPKKVVKEDASAVKHMAKNKSWLNWSHKSIHDDDDEIENDEHVEEKSDQLLKHHEKHQEKKPLSHDQKKSIKGYTLDSERFNKHLIEKHTLKSRRKVPDHHWDGMNGIPDDKERAAHDVMHKHLSDAYHPMGGHFKLWAGVSSRVSKAVKKSKNGIIHPGGGHISTTYDKDVAQTFAAAKTKGPDGVKQPYGKHHYMCIHAKPKDNVLSTEDNSKWGTEREVLVKDKLKHIGTTKHYVKHAFRNMDGSYDEHTTEHHVDHFEIHHDGSK